MKTAIQELIDELERVRSMTNMNFVIRIATDLLQKEKEQIIDAYRIAAINNTDKQKWHNLDNEYFEICANQYFEKHFNQNK